MVNPQTELPQMTGVFTSFSLPPNRDEPKWEEEQASIIMGYT